MLTCQNCTANFEITDEDRAFYAKLSIPVPTWCPKCRLQRMLTWRNENVYYQRQCDLCQRNIISVYSKKKSFPVYCNKCWWSDQWDPLKYGQDFDFSRPFFEQFWELQQKVPQLAMMNDEGVGSDNCEYCQDFAFGKNCYLVTGSWRLQDCYYSNNCNYGRDLMDCASVNLECELAYECILSQKLYNCTFLNASENSKNCHFGYDLKGCSDCFGCVGLRQKQFYIFNQPYSEQEYKKKMEEFDEGSYSTLQALKKQFETFLKDFPRKATHQINCQNSVGDNLYNCKDSLAFDTFNAEGCKYFYKGDGPKFSYDVYQTGHAEWCNECLTPDDSYMAIYSLWCWKSKFILYSDNCHSSENCFGSIALKRNRHCILNKQYSEEGYRDLMQKIIQHMQASGEWGQFFPSQYSPFAYNESIAGEYFPKTKEEAKGLQWEDDLPFTTGKETMKPDQIPDHIQDAQELICNEFLGCISCGRNYKIIPQELSFYRKMNLALPRQCPTCRRQDRRNRKNAYQLFDRNCFKCHKAIQTAYSEQKVEKVYCEECYLREVY